MSRIQVIDLGGGERASWDGSHAPMLCTTDVLGAENMITLHDTTHCPPGSLAGLLGQEVVCYKFSHQGWRLRIVRVLRMPHGALFAYASEAGGGGTHIRLVKQLPPC